MSESKKRFNLIDLVIIAVVICAVFVAWKFLSSGTQVAGDEVYYKVNVLKTEQTVAEQIQVGDKLFDSVKNFEIGEITDVAVYDATESVYDEITNTFKVVTVPERKDVLISVTGKGYSSPEGTVVNGYELYVGKKMYIKGANFATEAVAVVIGGEK